MPFKLEAWPGGRWFRDLGDNNGHCWATVQAIKRPTLLEFSGPLMMSFPVSNNVQYRLTEDNGETLIKFHHSGFGNVPEDFKKGMKGGWTKIHEASAGSPAKPRPRIAPRRVSEQSPLQRAKELNSILTFRVIHS